MYDELGYRLSTGLKSGSLYEEAGLDLVNCNQIRRRTREAVCGDKQMVTMSTSWQDAETKGCGTVYLPEVFVM